MNKIIKSLLVLVLGISIGTSYHDEINAIIAHRLEELGYRNQLESKPSLENTYGNNSKKAETLVVIPSPKSISVLLRRGIAHVLLRTLSIKLKILFICKPTVLLILRL